MGRMFRLLRADEIECRVATCTKNGVSLLLYKNARCDMSILDETVGAHSWQRDHKELKGVIYAGVGILNNESGEWIWKWDAGAESYTEKEKGEASDSFKRACVNWGIGRELYTAPFIWVKAEDTKLEEYTDNGKTKYRCKDNFIVRSIEYENDTISYLLICNKRGEIVYQYGVAEADKTPRTKLIAYCKSIGIDMNDVAAKYELGKGSTDDDYIRALEGLKNVSK